MLALQLLTVPTFCLFCSNTKNIARLLGNGIEESLIPHHINLSEPSQVSNEDYTEMFNIIKMVKEDKFPELGLNACNIEDELNKVITVTRKDA